MSAIAKIEAQQKGKENTAPWMVGEQLKEILAQDPSLEELLDKDLDNDSMSLDAAEGMIHSWADKHKEKNSRCVCVAPNVAEEIIRKFYGLPEKVCTAEINKTSRVEEAPMVDLSSFF